MLLLEIVDSPFVDEFLNLVYARNNNSHYYHFTTNYFTLTLSSSEWPSATTYIAWKVENSKSKVKKLILLITPGN